MATTLIIAILGKAFEAKGCVIAGWWWCGFGIIQRAVAMNESLPVGATPKADTAAMMSDVPVNTPPCLHAKPGG